MSSDSEAADTGLLDEEDELYGYGVFNVHQNVFVPRLDTNGDRQVFHDDETAIDHYLDTAEDVGDTAHLRLVRVTLDNALDAKAVEALEEGR